MSVKSTMEQLDSLCFEKYGYHVDNRYMNDEGYNMGSFSVAIPARSSVNDIASKFNETIGLNRVQSPLQQPGRSFVASAVHVNMDVTSNATESKVYTFTLTGIRLFTGSTKHTCCGCTTC